jgi:hypothetical protein
MQARSTSYASSGSVAPVYARGYHVPIWSRFGEGRAKSLAPGRARGGRRSRFSCGLLWGFRGQLSPFFSVGDYVVGLVKLDPPLFLIGLGIALLLAAASLSLPALALGARAGHLTKTALLSGPGFCAFVFFLLVSLGGNVAFVLFALVALVATSVIGSLVAIREEGPFTVRLGRATVIAAVAIYCASLLTWLVYGGREGLLYSLAPVIVASSSWPVGPAIVASPRPD